ncbi:peptidyl-prolyl cis-trans isomerase [Primorskyibacter sp. S187A]|uniref:peptidylprolyl isomerase n=1 Tax=Primorskyibacter sp. S187A TaxID=3415130 RepID=UPI003C7CC88F
MAGKTGGIGKTFVWILMGLLFVGLAGFGATNLSGTVRTVGSVGDEVITVDDYARAVQQELRTLSAQAGQAVSFRDLQQAGVIDRIISQLVTTAALDNEAREMGISISDERLGREIVGLSAFQGIDGQFDREAYSLALQNNGFSEAEFEEDLRNETARTILQGAVISGNTMPDVFTTTLLDYVAETRDFTFARLTDDVLQEPVPAPTDAEMAAFHGANTALYTVPETRVLTYAWLTPEMLIDTVEIDEATLRAEYEANRSQYVQPERRLVERLVMPDAAAADAARAQIDTGETTFEAVVESRDLTLADVDLGDVTRDTLGDAAAAVFDADEGQVVGPFDTDLGPALFRINGILPAQETSLEEATPLLREALAQDRARRAVEALVQDLDDLLAGGATLEQLSQETDMEFGKINWTTATADGIAAYDAFRAAALSVTEDDFPEILALGDGGVFAMRLDEIIPPRPQTLDEVRERVFEDWTIEATRNEVLEEAERMAGLLSEGRSFEALGLEPLARRDQTRRGLLIDLPAETLVDVFALENGGTTAIPGEGTEAIVIRLDAINAPDRADGDTAELATALQQQSEGSIAQDLFQALARDIQQRAGLQIDQQALNAVNVNFQ